MLWLGGREVIHGLSHLTLISNPRTPASRSFASCDHDHAFPLRFDERWTIRRVQHLHGAAYLAGHRSGLGDQYLSAGHRFRGPHQRNLAGAAGNPGCSRRARPRDFRRDRVSRTQLQLRRQAGSTRRKPARARRQQPGNRRSNRIGKDNFSQPDPTYLRRGAWNGPDRRTPDSRISGCIAAQEYWMRAPGNYFFSDGASART